MKSIRNQLVRTLSLTITGVVVLILLATDIAVDTWVDSQFNKAMHAKAGMLMTLVSEDEEGIEFEFAGEFMPEFEGKIEPEYYQLWLNDAVFERSDSLDLFTVHDLPFIDLAVDESKIVESVLPDGRDGRTIYHRFVPQIDSDERQALLSNASNRVPPIMLLAYATSAENLNFVFWLIDIVFVVTTLSVVIFIRMFVRKSVDTGLSPLNKLIDNIGLMSIADKDAHIQLQEPVKELTPIVDSLNTFIVENRQQYLREKRLTSDIAHELKTPIAELINLAEVVLRFPDSKELEKDFGPEVLRISKRLKNIVSNILLLHKHANEKLDKSDVFDVNQVVERLLPVEGAERINFVQDGAIEPIVSNLFAVELILTNLINNAFTHSTANSRISIHTNKLKAKQVSIEVINQSSTKLNKGDLVHIFEPLWQKDTARTSDENFGLGLSIANALAQAIDASLQASLVKDNVRFQLLLNV